MGEFFSWTNDFLLLESCQLYIIAKFKTSNCCKIKADIQRCSVKKEKLWKIHRKNPVPSLFFNKGQGMQLTKRLWHRCFPVNIAKLLKHLFYITPPVASCGKIRIRSIKSANF